MSIRIALAGNPNSGKTTLFNALTGANQYVGNWPGVTVEKKEGRLRKHEDVIITDLPGIYSLSPYTPEEVVARNYLVGERPDAILNIVDGTNLERNLYLTTQLVELGIPVVVAINMIDLVKKEGDRINTAELSKQLGCKVVEISALKLIGVQEAAQEAILASRSTQTVPLHPFSGPVEHALAHIEEAVVHGLPEDVQRWYAIKVFERDRMVIEQLGISEQLLAHVEQDIKAAEKELDDDAEAIITNERYVYISQVIRACFKKKNTGKLSLSDRIDRVVTNRWLGLPIFVAVMFCVYYISMMTIGSFATDWVNDNLFGDGYHLLGIGAAEYEEKSGEFSDAVNIIDAYMGFEEGKTVEDIEVSFRSVPAGTRAGYTLVDEETLAPEEVTFEYTNLVQAVEVMKSYDATAPEPSEYGIWVPGIPALVGSALEAAECSEWLRGLILDGIIAGVGAVLGFVPQMLVLFFLLAVLEGCGYMARIAFVLDRVFRRFGLSGKSFIPILIGTGCGIPGIMASRTIENERDRRMTIMTTTFIPCGAKVPFISMIAGAIFGGSALVATSAYFVGMAAIILSGIILKKTRFFSGDPAPFVMELPAYHLPTAGSVLRVTWERGWSFIRKAGTIILLSTVFVWFATYFGFTSEGFRMLGEDEIDMSILARIGSVFAFIFRPLGFGTWQAGVATITGLVAKENIVGTMGIVYGGEGLSTVYSALANAFSRVSGYSFLVFNLLCAPCFAAMGAIRREMNSRKWTWFAILYECGFAYVIAFLIFQFGSMAGGNGNAFGFISAVFILAALVYLLVRPAGRRR